jgi:hypothetical protein
MLLSLYFVVFWLQQHWDLQAFVKAPGINNVVHLGNVPF